MFAFPSLLIQFKSPAGGAEQGGQVGAIGGQAG